MTHDRRKSGRRIIYALTDGAGIWYDVYRHKGES